MSTIDHNSHYWFPCVNSYSELNTWKIEVVVEEDLTVVSSGNLIEIEELDIDIVSPPSSLLCLHQAMTFLFAENRSR